MGKRKALSKKIRFEVFKRDKFTCQYCGRIAPDVILEVDHINPIAEGGENDLLNLITSCRDCNRGKGKVRLSDDSEIKKQQKQLKDLADKNEQLEFLIQWKEELMNYQEKRLNSIIRYIEKNARDNFELTEVGMNKVRDLIRQFSDKELIDAIDISFRQYYKGDGDSFEVALNKIGGICYNRRNS